ncbi:hypothetical protein D9M69_726960 [compost metagenome]
MGFVMGGIGNAQLVQHRRALLVGSPGQPGLAGGAGQQGQRGADIGAGLQGLVRPGRFHVHHLQAVAHH